MRVVIALLRNVFDFLFFSSSNDLVDNECLIIFGVRHTTTNAKAIRRKRNHGECAGHDSKGEEEKKKQTNENHMVDVLGRIS